MSEFENIAVLELSRLLTYSACVKVVDCGLCNSENVLMTYCLLWMLASVVATVFSA